MQKEDKYFWIGLGVGFLAGAFIAFMMTVGIASDELGRFKKKCVENGAAHYDTKTGVFTWKNEVTE